MLFPFIYLVEIIQRCFEGSLLTFRLVAVLFFSVNVFNKIMFPLLFLMLIVLALLYTNIFYILYYIKSIFYKIIEYDMMKH